MSLKTAAGKLDDETLARLRAVEVCLEAVRHKPGAFSQFDIEEIFMRHYRLMGEIAEAHGLEPTRWWSIDERTGYIVFND